MTTFCQIHSLKSLINEFTCHKDPNKPSSIDLIMTNRPKSFQNSCTFETRLTNFQKMTLAVMKVSFIIQKSRVLNYRKHKLYNNKFFRESFLSKLNINNLSKRETGLKRFQEIYLTVLNSIASLECKFVRANQTTFMNKELH